MISDRQFSGIRPILHEHSLPQGAAQTALNLKLWNGSLRGFKGLTETATGLAYGVPNGRVGSFTRHVNGVGWLASTVHTSTFEVPGREGSSKRLYFIDRMNNKLGYWERPPGMISQLKYVGVTNPTSTINVAIEGPSSGAKTVSKSFVFTNVNSYGEESAPSPPSVVASAAEGQNFVLTQILGMEGRKRVYGTNGSDSSAGFFFIDEMITGTSLVLTAASFINAGASALGEKLSTEGFLPPPGGLAAGAAQLIDVAVLPNGVIVLATSEGIYYSEPNYPYAFPVKNLKRLNHPIVAVKTVDQTQLVLTNGHPYRIDGLVPDEMVERRMEMDQACLSVRGACNVIGGIAYVSPDGLWVLGANGQEQMITADIFDRDQWQSMNPGTMQLAFWDRRIALLYEQGLRSWLMLFDMSQGGAPVQVDVNAHAIYADPSNDRLFLATATDSDFGGMKIEQFDSGAEMEWTYRSKVFRMPKPVNPCVMQVIPRKGKPVNVRFSLYADGNLVLERMVTNDEIQRLPAGYKGSEFEYQLTGYGGTEIIGVDIARNIPSLAAT